MPPVAHRRPTPFSIYTLLSISIGILAAMVYRLSSRQQENTVPFAPPTLIEAINNTIVLNPLFNGTVGDYNCSRIIQIIEEGINTLDSARRNLELAVNRGMVIVCEPEDLPQKNHFTASYEQRTRKIHIVSNVSNIFIEKISHEASHFLTHLRHNTPNCPSHEVAVCFPLYLNMTELSVTKGKTKAKVEFLIDDNSILRLKNLPISLDKGIERIKYFKEMWIKSVGGISLGNLSVKEVTLFKQYRDAAKTSLLWSTVTRQELSKELYDKFSNEMSRNGKAAFFSFKDECPFRRNIIHFEISDGKYYIHTKSLDPEANIFDLIDSVSRVLKEYYTDRIEIDLIMERFELLFQTLSLSARDNFFPETMALLREEEIRCPLPEPGYQNALVAT